MSSTLGSPPTSPPPNPPAQSGPASSQARVPPATRASAPGWRDPRLWIGVAIVAASVLVGTRVLAAADDTVAVWVLADDAGVGKVIAPDDLVAERVRFADEAALDRYLAVDEALPEGLRLLRGIGAGELLPRAALGEAGLGELFEVSLPVAPLLVPPSVTSGSVVDIYLSERSASDERRASGPALSEVTVVDAPPPEEAFAVGGDRQVVLAVEPDAVADFYATLGALGDPVITVVR
ncbi:hypothetical protein, partial [Nocardioides sp.]|uniref:hypothetical protein n=1 Tax=Nocardioides sp. TaxID=35761 RepID=UPI002B279B36